MSEVLDVVRSLESRGVEFHVEGETVRFRGTGPRLTNSEREVLVKNKGEVLAYLTQESSRALHGTSPGGRPMTWTGKVVSLAEWRGMSEWDRHGPGGKQFNGRTGKWEANQ